MRTPLLALALTSLLTACGSKNTPGASSASASAVAEAPPPSASHRTRPARSSWERDEDTSSLDEEPINRTPLYEKIESTVKLAKAALHAVEAHVEQSSDQRCPTVKDLVDARELKPDASVDPWGNPLRIQCLKSGDLHVSSDGVDRREGTKDDIRDDFKVRDIRMASEL
jgi:hypothetical protein